MAASLDAIQFGVLCEHNGAIDLHSTNVSLPYVLRTAHVFDLLCNIMLLAANYYLLEVICTYYDDKVNLTNFVI